MLYNIEHSKVYHSGAVIIIEHGGDMKKYCYCFRV